MTSFWGELKRRNVVRVAIAYAIVSWLILQLTDVLMPLLSLPQWVGGLVFLLLVIGFLLALILSWAYELTPEGVKLENMSIVPNRLPTSLVARLISSSLACSLSRC